ncbi:transcriptional regulator, IclR family [Curtobacterium sp. UNCCL20]|uniref:IclR family transcriptional regulator n=1 Tax=Curtobacterium sp. UNCCL20 TaxID=1502773 RepID=UPI0008817D0E|nr:IclR family transcriptional regulator [Curtobacterium sp. UNCCL20]SDQ92102.1 transcriptional regulator, IclR family [Curtobacterium sp. UNCCL20]
MTATMQPSPHNDGRLVGSDRVLAVLVELARHHEGTTLDDIAQNIEGSKPTVHRALASLCRAGLAQQDARGHYVLGDEFLRMAFTHHAARPDHLRIQPILERLAERTGETTHYAVLDGRSIVYRAKVDPTRGSMRLTSTIGGRNPAHTTGVGKLLLAYALRSEDDIHEWIGDRPLERPTDRSITAVEAMHAEFQLIRERGYALDDQENEMGVNCVALPYFRTSSTVPDGGVSISGIAHRTRIEDLVNDLPALRHIVEGQAKRA